jgi:dihydropteroate synthase
LAASRKSVIGLTLDLDTDQRLEGTIATSVIGVMKGCSFVRVHDVKENLRAVKMALAVRKAKA